jgi:hypothetical protein
MELCELVVKLLEAKHGWAVAEQFEDTFNDIAFEEQNYNALQYIKEEVTVILRSTWLAPDAKPELEEYLDELTQYLNEE